MYYDRNFKTYQIDNLIFDEMRRKKERKEKGEPETFEDCVELQFNEILDFLDELSGIVYEQQEKIENLEKYVKENCVIRPFNEAK